MSETAVEIRTSDGTSDGFLYQSDGGKPRPGVIHLTDIGGIRASHRGMAQRLADQGFRHGYLGSHGSHLGFRHRHLSSHDRNLDPNTVSRQRFSTYQPKIFQSVLSKFSAFLPKNLTLHQLTKYFTKWHKVCYIRTRFRPQ